MKTLKLPIGLWMWGIAWAVWAAPNSTSPWALHSEKTQFQETGTYQEVEHLCDQWSKRYPTWVSCQTLGKTAEGRNIRALVVSKSGVLQAAAAKRKNIPVMLVIGGTHAGEIDGKDASLILTRSLLASSASDNPLRHLVMVLVPVFNVDGHEHRSPFNRPNQNGPKVQGERTTALRVNLNRDWMLAQTPEMQSMLAWVHQWDPVLTLDLHVTDGIRYRHDVSLSMSPMFSENARLSQLSTELQQGMLQRLTAMGHTPLDFYPVFNDLEDPSAGIMQEVESPRFSHVYAVLKNRLGILVEDYAWNDYASRIQTCMDTLKAALEEVTYRKEDLLKVARHADEQGLFLGGKKVALDWRNVYESGPAHPSGTMDLQGYRYEVHEDAPVVGGRRVSYDITQPSTWTVPVYKNVRKSSDTTLRLPEAGYIVPAAWASVVKPHLQRHGLRYTPLTAPVSTLNVEALRVNDGDVAYEPNSFQGRQRTTLKGQWTEEQSSVRAGALFVPIHQPKGLLVAHLLEPSAPDSLSSWGLFNTAYEVSDYVAGHRELELARWMYHQDPKILEIYGEAIYQQLPQWRKIYEERLAKEPGFLEDTEARMDFWMNRLPSQDPQRNLYPIYRVNQSPLAHAPRATRLARR
jgi:hypothetical protein